MDPERWQQVKSLLDRSQEKSAEELPAWLDEVCAGDPRLRDEVTRLLSYEDRLEAFSAAAPFAAPAAGELAAGTRVGPYRIRELLARGGMGAVYRAERSAGFQQAVALKLMRSGLETAGARERFHREREILAGLEHPHIGRLLDGGESDDGRPYFALELIDGEPIDRYADRRRLTPRQRLELLLPVCDALGYIHRNLVIHRDLKPSNILVDADGVPKLLDFGIAKLIGPEAATVTGDQILTPRYASPEQLLGGPVSTASDVYSLGVVLYQLLTGRLPSGLDTASSSRVFDAVCRQEPRPPSAAVTQAVETVEGGEARRRAPEGVAAERGTDPRTLRRELRGDLDSIVLKALRKEPERRYSSVERFADDLRRHLADLPVRARRGTFAYRAGRFARRHPWRLAMAAALVALSLGFTALLARQLERTERQRDRAELAARRAEIERAHARREAETARQVSDFLVGLFESSDPRQSGRRADEVTAREILDRGTEQLRGELADQPEVRARMLTAVAEVHVSLGLFRQAEPLVREGLEIRQALAADSLEVAESLQLLGRLTALSRGPVAELEPLFRRAVEIRERRLGGDDLALAQSLRSLGVVRQMMGRSEEARSLLERALAIRERQLGGDHADVGEVLLRLALIDGELGRFDAAIPRMERAVRISERDLGREHPRMVPVLGHRARLYLDAGRLDQAEPFAEGVLALAESRLGDDHQFTAESLQTLARIHIARSRYRQAEPLLTRALSVYRKKGSDFRVRVAALCLQATVYRQLGRTEEAAAFLERGAEISRDAGREIACVGDGLARLSQDDLIHPPISRP